MCTKEVRRKKKVVEVVYRDTYLAGKTTKNKHKRVFNTTTNKRL